MGHESEKKSALAEELKAFPFSKVFLGYDAQTEFLDWEKQIEHGSQPFLDFLRLDRNTFESFVIRAFDYTGHVLNLQNYPISKERLKTVYTGAIFTGFEMDTPALDHKQRVVEIFQENDVFKKITYFDKDLQERATNANRFAVTLISYGRSLRGGSFAEAAKILDGKEMLSKYAKTDSDPTIFSA